MPKMKTNAAAKKRFERLKGGKIKRACANRRHILTKKSRQTKRDLRGVAYVSKPDYKHILGLLPY